MQLLNWNFISHLINYVTFDRDGKANGFKNKPLANTTIGIWYGPTFQCRLNHLDKHSCFNNWQDLIFKRPANKQFKQKLFPTSVSLSLADRQFIEGFGCSTSKAIRYLIDAYKDSHFKWTPNKGGIPKFDKVDILYRNELGAINCYAGQNPYDEFWLHLWKLKQNNDNAIIAWRICIPSQLDTPLR